MSQENELRALKIFEAALAQTPEERAAFVERSLGEAPELRERVESLLAAQPQVGSFLASPAAGLVPPDSTDQFGSDFGVELADALPPGDTIPGYRILREIHRGGQGVVYQAVQESAKRKVAIKVLLEGPFASKDARRRFEREIAVVGSLRHPGIVPVFDSGVTEGKYWFVMEYIRGEPLDTHVHQKELTVDDTLRLFAKVCDAVDYAHQKGVIHRDLKPSNILVDERGEPHVLDFGLAKIGGAEVEDDESLLVSVTGQVMGTLPYMSPEQATGRSDQVDMRSDVYALGVVLYELLTKEYPYDVTGQVAEVLRNIQDVSPKRPSTIRRQVNDEVETIVLKALSKEKERRYATAGGLGDDVACFLRGDPIEAKRDSALYLLRKTVYRYRKTAAVVAGFALVVVTAVVALGMLYYRSENLADERGKESARAREAEELALDRARALEESTVRLALGQLYGAQSAFQRGDLQLFRSLLESCPEEVGGWPWRRLRYLDLLMQRQGSVIQRDDANISCAAFSPDSRALVWGTGDGRLVCYNLDEGKISWETVLLDSGRMIASLAHGADVILVGSDEEKIRLVDPRTGRVGRSIEFHRAARYVVISPDGSRFACSSGWDATFDLLDVRSGETIATLSRLVESGNRWWRLYDMKFSPSGERLAAACRKNVFTWDLRETSGEIVGMPIEVGSSVRAVAFSDDGGRLLFGTDEGKVSIIDGFPAVSNTMVVGTDLGSTWHVVLAGAVAAATSGSRVVLWSLDAPAGTAPQSLVGHDSVVNFLEISPDGRYLASADSGGELRLWDLRFRTDRLVKRSWKPVKTRTHSGRLSLSPDGRRLAWSSGAHEWYGPEWTALFDTQSLAPVAVLPSAGGQGAFSPDSRMLAVALGRDRPGARVFDVTTSKERRPVPSEHEVGRNKYATRGVAWAPDGRTLALGSDQDGKNQGWVELWTRDADEEWTRSATLETKAGVVDLAFALQADELVAVTERGKLMLLDPRTLAVRATLDGDRRTRDLALTPDGRKILLASSRSIRFFDREGRRELEHLRIRPAAGADGLTVDAGGAFVAIGNQSGVEIWHIETGIKTLTLDGTPVRSLLFGKDGTLFCVAHTQLDVWPALASPEEVERSIESARAVALAPGVLGWADWAAEGLARNSPFADPVATADPLPWAIERSRLLALLESADAAARFDSAVRASCKPQRWRFAGPFPCGADADASLAKVFPVENVADPTTVEGIHWSARTIAALDDARYRYSIDLNSIVESKATSSAPGARVPSVLFAFARIRSARPITAGLHLFARDGARVWVNGTPMDGTWEKGVFSDGRPEARMELRAGENTLLVKIATGGWHWDFGVSIVDESGKPIELEWLE